MRLSLFSPPFVYNLFIIHDVQNSNDSFSIVFSYRSVTVLPSSRLFALDENRKFPIFTGTANASNISARGGSLAERPDRPST